MVCIDYRGFPHIFQAILSNIPRDELSWLRCLSRDVRDIVDAQLAQHVILNPAHNITLLDIADLFGASPPPNAPIVAVLCAVDLDASEPSHKPRTDMRGPWSKVTEMSYRTLGMGIPFFSTAAKVQDAHILPPAIEERLARDNIALARTRIVDLVGKVLPEYWALIPRARTVRIFPGQRSPTIDNSAFLALEAIRPDTAVLFTRPIPPEWPAKSSAPRHLQFPRTRRLVVHVTPPHTAHGGSLRHGDILPVKVVWTPPGRGGFQADDELVYIFSEDWCEAWENTVPPAYVWNVGCPDWRPHRSVPMPTTE